MPRSKNHYETLDLAPNASPDEIAFAYRRLVEQFAREGKPEDSPDWANLRTAYETLSHPMERAAYNAAGLPAAEEARLADISGADASSLQEWLSVPWVRWALGGVGLIIVLIMIKSQIAARIAPQQQAARVITATKEAEGIASGGLNDTPLGVLPRTAEEIFSAVGPSVAKVIVNDSAGNTVATGSGVVVGPGIVITNCHVVTRQTNIQVKFPNETFSASIQQRDDERDICRLYAGNISARPVPVSSVNSLRVGQKVFAIGSPYGLENTLSEGLVSALREVPGGTVIQTSAPISPGSSGGGLFDQFGNLVGIMTFQHKYGQNLNFAVPADWIGNLPSGAATPRFSSSDPTAPAGGIYAAPAAPREPTAHDLLPGKWTCVGTFEGTTGTWTFSKTGSVVLERDGKSTAKKSFALQATKLVVFDPMGDITLDIDEIKSDKLNFSNASGRKLTCEKAPAA